MLRVVLGEKTVFAIDACYLKVVNVEVSVSVRREDRIFHECLLELELARGETYVP